MVNSCRGYESCELPGGGGVGELVVIKELGMIHLIAVFGIGVAICGLLYWVKVLAIRKPRDGF